MISFTVYGQCYSMKNSKTLSTRGGRPRSIKHPKAEAFSRDFEIQTPGWARKNLTCDVSVKVDVYYPSRRQDLDAELVYDLLQRNGVIANDRQIVEKHAFKYLDRERPRVEITITPAI